MIRIGKLVYFIFEQLNLQKMTRRKSISRFKTKVVLEVLKEINSLTDLAQKYEIAPQQMSK